MSVVRDVGAGDDQGMEDHLVDCLATGGGRQDVAQLVDDLHPQPAKDECRGDQRELVKASLHDEGAGTTGAASGMTCASPWRSRSPSLWRMSQPWWRQAPRKRRYYNPELSVPLHHAAIAKSASFWVNGTLK